MTGYRALKHFKIKDGDRPIASGASVQRIEETATASTVALIGADAPQLRPKFEVTEGDTVALGQVLFRDRKHPDIAYVAPISGKVSEVAFGPRRTLSACVIQADQGPVEPYPVVPLDAGTADSVRHHLRDRGMWPAFRTRPFGRTPSPLAQPAAIFVNAVHASPFMPDPRLVLEGQMDAFRFGVSVLTQLTDGLVHVCQSQGDALMLAAEDVQTTCFSGTLAAGLVGTHIDRLHPKGLHREVWSIGYQDVVAIGHLFQTGQYTGDRVISVTDTAVSHPKLIQTCLGANIADLCVNEPLMIDESRSARLVSGDPYTGYESRFLGRFHTQITLDEKLPKRAETWLTRLVAKAGPLIPTSTVERALAVDVMPVPLMRALSVGDCEAAQRLGCLALIEEDVVALSRRCTSGADYATLLRQVLDELMEDAA